MAKFYHLILKTFLEPNFFMFSYVQYYFHMELLYLLRNNTTSRALGDQLNALIKRIFLIQIKSFFIPFTKPLESYR